MEKQVVLSVDLGGTNLRIGLVDRDGLVLSLQKYPLTTHSEQVLAVIGDHLQRISAEASGQGLEIVGLGLGFPGIVDAARGIVFQSPHFPEWNSLDVLSYFKGRFSCPIVLDNDANMIALGELWKGAGAGLENFILLTLGTGVGGGIVIERRVFRGDHGFAGELGHLVIEQDGFHCHCGGRGCLEMYVSATGIKELIRASDDVLGKGDFFKKLGLDVEHLTVKKLHDLTLEGDAFAHAIFRKMGHCLGIGIASLVNVLGISNVLIGGGVSEAADFFLPAAQKEIRQRSYRETAERVRIKRCQLGDQAGLIGGAYRLFAPPAPYQ